ncbi:Rz-like spanin [Xanthomonas phage XAJ24]|uniref:Putative i-spanin n=1 Tax=Xanthomonas phage XAJ24 TaxID=1775250 RepID=A0A1I9L2C5_9CAUD|nr:Rz-like spanin [Xanthomonas phage XAJ24]AMW36112.1 putative i-spanin [Xanthomonas phage XAJ24]
METPTEMTARLAGKAIGLLLVVVMIVCFGLYVRGLQRKVDRLETAQVGLTATSTAAKTQATGYATYIKEKEDVRVRTEEALDAVPEYRDGAVPADVADLLREPAGSK